MMYEWNQLYIVDQSKYKKALGNPKIDNSTGIYYLRVHLPQSPEGFLHDVRIGYTKR